MEINADGYPCCTHCKHAPHAELEPHRLRCGTCIRELCKNHGVSHVTMFKWLERRKVPNA